MNIWEWACQLPLWYQMLIPLLLIVASTITVNRVLSRKVRVTKTGVTIDKIGDSSK